MADLITSARAKYNLNNLATTSDEDTTIAALVTACSKAIRRHCKREFDSQSFDELFNGDGQERLQLRQHPVIAVARVAFGPSTVLRVTNTSASNQRATAAVTATGLSLTRVASGVSSTDTSVTWAGNATLAAVATAVNALGNGWSAAVANSAYNLRASADLRAVQGALNATNVQAELKMHLGELTDYEVDTSKGWLIRTTWDAAWPWQHGGRGGWHGGLNYWRVIYTAGYATVPEDVQEACRQWVAALFWQTKRDPGLKNETIVGAVGRTPRDDLPASVRTLVAPYRDINVLSLGG